ncbi:restriction endonuclease subunit S [Cellulophaga sp. HaHa_2_95]|uniref:restriction endonuclease subunit S n=1 Tax=Cellulophaga sp. HaHa_2_95 TaxID=2745558 RepID=UPI001C4F6C07|nr:restriction endonuclease subunit S [Cellulophaga sp. HaHa_2_95]QXP57155.1 restriction endonuclease subunit S [Cellulophaga sp. HaHa_2_95]
MELEMRKGFKQTEFGTIPNDWKEVNLGKSSVLKARIGWQGLTTAEYLKTGDYFLITGTDFKNGYIDWDNCVYVERIRYDQDKNIQIKVEDVLVTKDGTIGKVAYVDKLPMKTTLNSGVFVIRPINNFYNTRYFYFVLRSRHFKEFLGKLTAGSTISHLYQKDFVHYSFPLPPTLAEQKAIATALSDVDDLISSVDAVIAKKKAIKQGAMQQLLTPPSKGGKRLDGFDGEWERKEVQKFINVGRGGSPRPIQDYITNSPDGVNWIKIGDTSKLSKYITSSKEKIIQDGEVLSRSVKVGDFLLSNSMSFGRPYILKIDGCIHDGWLVLQDYQDYFDIDFLYYTLMSKDVFDQYLQKASGSGVLNLNKELVKVVELNRPTDLKEQKSISQILSDMDRELDELATKKEKYEHIKQGMMQELLNGKTRLV